MNRIVIIGTLLCFTLYGCQKQFPILPSNEAFVYSEDFNEINISDWKFELDNYQPYEKSFLDQSPCHTYEGDLGLTLRSFNNNGERGEMYAGSSTAFYCLPDVSDFDALRISAKAFHMKGKNSFLQLWKFTPNGRKLLRESLIVTSKFCGTAGWAQNIEQSAGDTIAIGFKVESLAFSPGLSYLDDLVVIGIRESD